jgi:hypothetical protein
MQQEQTLKILSDLTKKDIEKMLKTEAHYTQRYGWTLRRTGISPTVSKFNVNPARNQ